MWLILALAHVILMQGFAFEGHMFLWAMGGVLPGEGQLEEGGREKILMSAYFRTFGEFCFVSGYAGVAGE